MRLGCIINETVSVAQREHAGVGRPLGASPAVRGDAGPLQGGWREHSVWPQCPAAVPQSELRLSVSASSDTLALIYLKPLKTAF